MNSKVHFKEMQDQSTGRRYERISPEGLVCHYPYFYLNMINPKTNQMLIIIEENKMRNLHLLNLEDGEVSQLTFFTEDDKFDDFGPQFSKDFISVIYDVNNQIVKQNIDSGEISLLYTPEEGWDTYAVPAISDDDKYLLTVDFPISDFVNRDNSNWDAFIEQGKKGLRSQLVRVDLRTGDKEVLIDTADYEAYGLKKNQWLGHPQFKPASHSIISYCHEGLGGTVDARIWLYDYESKGIQCARKHEYPGEIISHEFFTTKGDRIGFVRIEDIKSDKGSLRFVDSKTLEESNVMDLPRCSHFLTNQRDDYIIADADYPAEPYIHLIDLNNKKDIFLLKHNSTMKSYGNTQDAHPHPMFSKDSRQIYFVSDMEGYPAIYRCDVSDLTKQVKG